MLKWTTVAPFPFPVLQTFACWTFVWLNDIWGFAGTVIHTFACWTPVLLKLTFGFLAGTLSVADPRQDRGFSRSTMALWPSAAGSSTSRQRMSPTGSCLTQCPTAATQKNQYVSDSDSEYDLPCRCRRHSPPDVVLRDRHLFVHKDYEDTCLCTRTTKATGRSHCVTLPRETHSWFPRSRTISAPTSQAKKPDLAWLIYTQCFLRGPKCRAARIDSSGIL